MAMLIGMCRRILDLPDLYALTVMERKKLDLFI